MRYLLIIACSLFCVSCLSSPKPVEQTAQEPVVQNTVEVVIEEPEKPEPVVEELVVVEEKTQEEAEYNRSVKDLNDNTVTKDVFAADKEAVMKIIAELSEIMKNRDYDSWVRYLTPDSVQYWSNPYNLKIVASKLPVKGVKLNTLRDYFIFMFIPSRLQSSVDEIRYISSKQVKVVQVTKETDIIYYNFSKLDNKWLLQLDTLEN